MITSFLFNSDNGLDTYRNDHVIQGLLGSNFVLLNLEEFLDWYEPVVSRQPLPRVAAAQNPFAATTLRRQVSHDEKLFKAIKETNVFNAKIYTKNLEQAYKKIYENYKNNLNPENIYLE